MHSKRTLIIGSRGSKLALTQAQWVMDELARRFSDVVFHIKVITTKGDVYRELPLARMGGKGIFTKELENALLDGVVDLAVHSLKDLPTEVHPELEICAIPKREDPHDALICRSPGGLDALPTRAKVGTSSLRRRAQLLAVRPDLQMVEFRGNLDTRLRKLAEGGVDAIVVALAGLQRLGITQENMQVLPYDVMLPAAGQGGLAVEVRKRDMDTQHIVRAIEDDATRRCVEAERALLAALEGGCRVPIGTLAQMENSCLRLYAVVCSPDGRTVVRGQLSGPPSDAVRIGTELAKRLRQQGADRILASVRCI